MLRPCSRPHSRYIARPLLTGAAAAIILGIGSAAQAQQWTLDSSLTQQFLYTDNLLLSPDNEIDTFGLVTTPALRLGHASPTLDMWLDGRFDFTEYIDHSEFNSQDQRVRASITKDMSERSKLNLNGSFVRDTTLRSEQETDRFFDEKIGITYWEVRPNWTYLLTPVDRMRMGGSYSSVAYDSSDKTDYQYFGGTLDYWHQLSEIDQFTTNLSFFRFVPEENGDTYTDTISGLVGYAYTPTERLSINGAAGLGYSFDHNTGDSDDSGLGYRLKFNARYELSDATAARFSLSHDSEPSSDGDQTTRNRATLGVTHKVTPVTTLALNVDYVDTYDYAGIESSSRNDDNESRYASVRPSISWALTEKFSLVAEYQYRYKLYEDSNDSAMSNTVFLSLRYELPTWGGDEDY